MDRIKIKCNVATALSDMGLGQGKLPLGRLDLLTDMIDDAPPEFKQMASTGVGPVKGTPEWRITNLWATTMTVKTRKIASERPVPGGKRIPRIKRIAQRVWLDMGQICMRKGLEKDLISAGQDYAADNPDVESHDIGVCRDLAEGTLQGEGVERNTPHYGSILSFAADLVSVGLNSKNN